MASRGDQTANGIPRWAGPWAAGWSGMANNSPSHSELERSSLSHREDRIRVHALPKGAQRRIQTIGFAASGVAATIWLSAIVWLWPIIA
jgi:hypothetical protein